MELQGTEAALSFLFILTPVTDLHQQQISVFMWLSCMCHGSCEQKALKQEPAGMWLNLHQGYQTCTFQSPNHHSPLAFLTFVSN